MNKARKRGVMMIKRYNFENPANKALMTEILTYRDRQPRMNFISSLAAVMVAAISLTMVFGSLSTGASQIEQQHAYAESNTDGETMPPDVVPRFHTDTVTETVVVHNDLPPITELLLLSKPVSADASAAESTGKAIFDHKKKQFQWLYNGELFTFFVKNNTVYRRSEKTGKTIAVFKGDREVAIYCVTDRYLFFRANKTALDGYNTFCYRADLITKEMLRLFNYHPQSISALYRDYEVEFVRIDGTDVIFTHYIVHEDGSYEEIPDDREHYPDSDNGKYYDLCRDISKDTLLLLLNDDNTISAEDTDGNRYDLGIDAKSLERFGFESIDSVPDGGWICCDKEGNKYIYFNFSDYNFTNLPLSSYYGKITDNGIDGAVIYVETTRLAIFYNPMFFLNEIYYPYTFLDKDHQEQDSELFVPINFDKLTASTMSEPDYYILDNGEKISITYYPLASLYAATPDSAD